MGDAPVNAPLYDGPARDAPVADASVSDAAVRTAPAADVPSARGPADRGGPTPCGPGGERLALAIPSRVSEIERVVEAVVARCVAREFPRRAVALNVPVALTEALANAIVKGNGEDAAKHVEVVACLDDGALVVEVRDEGAGFDLEASTNGPDDENFLEREDGRGLYLMRQLMDRVEQYAAPERGNVVRLTLRRRA